MSDEVLIFNDVNPYTGMRALLVKRAGQPVEIKNWIDFVPEPVRGKMQFYYYEMPQGLFTWHYLRLDWMTRELIGFEIEDSRLAAIDGWGEIIKGLQSGVIPAVAWMLEPGERISGAIRSAADLYWGTVGQYPQLSLARNLPKDSPDSLTLTPDPSPKTIRILKADWLWRNMVVVL